MKEFRVGVLSDTHGLLRADVRAFLVGCDTIIHGGDIGSADILEPTLAGVQGVISGHFHKPKIFERDGVCYLNPGSCGPRRFSLPISIGELTISGSTIRARTVELADAS